MIKRRFNESVNLYEDTSDAMYPVSESELDQLIEYAQGVVENELEGGDSKLAAKYDDKLDKLFEEIIGRNPI